MNRIALSSIIIAFFCFTSSFAGEQREEVMLWSPETVVINDAPRPLLPFYLTGAVAGPSRVEITRGSGSLVMVSYDYGTVTGTYKLERATDPTGPFQAPTSGQIVGVSFSGTTIVWSVDTARFPANRAVFRVKTPLTTSQTPQ